MTLRRAVIMAAIFVLTASCAFCADVTMGRYDPSQSGSTTEKLEFPLALSWEFTGHRFENNVAAPVVYGQTCIYACGDYIYAVDIDSGTPKWKYPGDSGLGGPIKGTPVIYKGNVYFGASDMNLYCLDFETGAFKWAYPTRGPIRFSPVVSENIMYFGADDNCLYAINAESGEALWKPFVARDDFSIGAAVGSNMVIASCMDGNVYGVNATSGKMRSVPYRLVQAPTATSPIIVDNVAIVSSGNILYGLTLRSNQLRWRISLPSEIAATPAAMGTDIYIPCKNKNLYKYNVSGRVPVSQWNTPAEIGGIPKSSPTVAGDVVYVTASKGVVSAFSTEDGSLKWRYVIAPSIVTTPNSSYTNCSSSPVVANGNLFVTTDDGVLHCFTSSAPDAEPPQVLSMVPASGMAMSGLPPIKMSCVLYDSGSGVDFSTANMSLDGQPVTDSKVDAATYTISYVTEVGDQAKAMKKLDDGIHTITVTAKDYKGNLVKKDWTFIVDNSLPAPKRIAPAVPTKKTKEPARKTENIINMPPQTEDGAQNFDGGAPPPPPPPGIPGFPGGPGGPPAGPDNNHDGQYDGPPGGGIRPITRGAH